MSRSPRALHLYETQTLRELKTQRNSRYSTMVVTACLVCDERNHATNGLYTFASYNVAYVSALTEVGCWLDTSDTAGYKKV
jgi:hypothetical protein